jgi:hypothetical protein
MTKLPDVVLYRAELYDEMCRTLQRAERAPGLSYHDLAWSVRDQTRQLQCCDHQVGRLR